MKTSDKIPSFMDYVELPLKFAACWDWYKNPSTENQILINNIYLCFVLFSLTKIVIGLALHLYTEWVDIMSSLDQIADSLPLLVSLVIISYFAVYKNDLYALVKYMNDHFKFRSARGLTNVTMDQSYRSARRFSRIYTACTMFSVTMYATLPVLVYFWTKQPIEIWTYSAVSRSPFIQFSVFLHTLLSQWLVGLAMGQFGVFFAANSILICGQLDLLCCSLRNVRFTALLQNGVKHSSIANSHGDIQLDERHSYTYSQAEMVDSSYHYDEKNVNHFGDSRAKFDIYDPSYDEATSSALRDCARLSQVVNVYKRQFEEFVSPLLAIRVVQVTLYLCTLLYAATLKFDMVTVEYLAAVALDTFVYCYYGNQIILQLHELWSREEKSFLMLAHVTEPNVEADRVSTAAYQSWWQSMSVASRKCLLNILLANRRPVVVRAGRFLPMDLHTFVSIIKTSFSYYTLLVNVNEEKK